MFGETFAFLCLSGNKLNSGDRVSRKKYFKHYTFATITNDMA